MVASERVTACLLHSKGAGLLPSALSPSPSAQPPETCHRGLTAPRAPGPSWVLWKPLGREDPPLDITAMLRPQKGMFPPLRACSGMGQHVFFLLLLRAF